LEEMLSYPPAIPTEVNQPTSFFNYTDSEQAVPLCSTTFQNDGFCLSKPFRYSLRLFGMRGFLKDNPRHAEIYVAKRKKYSVSLGYSNRSGIDQKYFSIIQILNKSFHFAPQLFRMTGFFSF